MKSCAEYEQEKLELVQEVDALFDKAEAENREFTEAERTRFESVTKPDGGLLAVAEKGAALAKQRERQEQVQGFGKGRAGIFPDAFGHGGWTETKSVVNLKLPKLKAFNTSGDREQDYKNAHQASLWIRGAVLQDQDAKAEMRTRYGSEWNATHVESIGSLGGYLVPTAIYDAVIAAREQVSASRQLARVVNMPSESLEFPKRTGGLTVYYPGEAGEIT